MTTRIHRLFSALKKMMKTKIVHAALATLLLVLLTGALVMALGEGVNGRFSITSGGGHLQANGVQLMVSIGQPVVGAVSNTDDVVLCSGLVCGEDTLPPNREYRVYLPMINSADN